MKKSHILWVALIASAGAWAQGSAEPGASDSPLPEVKSETTQSASPASGMSVPVPLTAEELDRIAAALRIYFRAEDEPLAEEAAAGEPLALTVDEAVAMAEDRNPSIAVGEDEVAAAQARIGQARAQRRPQLGGRAGATYTDLDTPDIGGSGPFGRLAKRFVGDIAGDGTTITGQVSVSQVIFAGGQIQNAIRASRYLANSQEWQLEVRRDELEFDTRETYYAVLLARALEKVAEESVVTFQRHLEDAQRMYDVGLISGFEVLRARTELGTRESDRVSASNGVRLAKANLRRLLALPPDTPLRLEGGPDLEPVTDPVNVLIELAHERRPELRALEQGIRAAEAQVQATKGQFLPRVAANGQYSQSDGDGSSFMAQDGLTATVGAEIDFYAGGRRKYEVVEARAEERNVRHQYEDVKNLVALDVTRAYIQLQNAAAQVLGELGNVELAREGLRLAELRFAEGVGTQTETLDASLALTAAESALAQALNDYAVARAALDRAVGDPVEGDAPPAARETP